jgi:hypothetical protein
VHLATVYWQEDEVNIQYIGAPLYRQYRVQMINSKERPSSHPVHCCSAVHAIHCSSSSGAQEPQLATLLLSCSCSLNKKTSTTGARGKSSACQPGDNSRSSGEQGHQQYPKVLYCSPAQPSGGEQELSTCALHCSRTCWRPEGSRGEVKQQPSDHKQGGWLRSVLRRQLKRHDSCST